MQRFLAELDPGNLELHDFDLFDWLLFANNFAQRVNYFDKDDNTTPKGNWGNFFLVMMTMLYREGKALNIKV